jgi:hypothetical protein
LGLDFQPDQKERTVLICLVQPREGVVFIAQTGIDDGRKIWTDVTLLCLVNNRKTAASG